MFNTLPANWTRPHQGSAEVAPFEGRPHPQIQCEAPGYLVWSLVLGHPQEANVIRGHQSKSTTGRVLAFSAANLGSVLGTPWAAPRAFPEHRARSNSGALLSKSQNKHCDSNMSSQTRVHASPPWVAQAQPSPAVCACAQIHETKVDSHRKWALGQSECSGPCPGPGQRGSDEVRGEARRPNAADVGAAAGCSGQRVVVRRSPVLGVGDFLNILQECPPSHPGSRALHGG